MNVSKVVSMIAKGATVLSLIVAMISFVLLLAELYPVAMVCILGSVAFVMVSFIVGWVIENNK